MAADFLPGPTPITTRFTFGILINSFLGSIAGFESAERLNPHIQNKFKGSGDLCRPKTLAGWEAGRSPSSSFRAAKILCHERPCPVRLLSPGRHCEKQRNRDRLRTLELRLRWPVDSFLDRQPGRGLQ